MKGAFWSTDWFVGIVMSAAVFAIAHYGFLSPLDQATYDWGVRLSSKTPNPDITIIAIDDASIQQLGAWPWPRLRYAEGIEMLEGAEPRSIAILPLLSNPQQDAGSEIVSTLLGFVDASAIPAIPDDVDLIDQQLTDLEAEIGRRAPEELAALRTYFDQSRLKRQARADITSLIDYLREMQHYLDADRRLAAQIAQSDRVILSMEFGTGTVRTAALPPSLARERLPLTTATPAPLLGGPEAPRFEQVTLPLPALSEHAAGIGHSGRHPLVIDQLREEPIALRFRDDHYPSMALLLAARQLHLDPTRIEVDPNRGLRLGTAWIETGPDLALLPAYYKGTPFKTYSFADLVNNNVPPSAIHDRTVLIGLTATDLSLTNQTPLAPLMTQPERVAQLVSNLLNRDYYVQPVWGHWASLVAYLLVAAYLILLLPRLRAALGTLMTVGILLLLAGSHLYLMLGLSLWIPVSLALTLLLLGHLAVETKRVLMAHRYTTHRESMAEKRRLDGLALQGRGKLDEAFAKLREVPLDDGMMEVLYNVGMDFERRGQFDRAQSVYEYMTGYDSDFRDLQQRMIRAKAMQGGGAPAIQMSKSGRFLIAEGQDRPMLGRYEVLKEIGKGAMGTVYLGQDPKISRTVAIKTLDLSQDFEEKEVEDVKARFFREAETAGKLSHPSIVTIYDAGEAHQLAYIAMEYLEGENLAPYTRSKTLLPLPTVLDIIARCAEALAYAHENQVVHRDIKPANIMYRPDTGEIKITDFGIARVTGGTRTRSGMVLGTPSYMSPEQLSGKRVDGRSDLFSLGVMCFQLVTGRLPFIADSMANLMYKIANEDHPSVRVLRPDVPECIPPIIDRVLEKDREKRYANGVEMAEDIRNCLKKLQ